LLENWKFLMQVQAVLSEEKNDKWKVNRVISIARENFGQDSKNLTKEIREWILTTNGYFTTLDLYTGLHLATRKDKKHAVTVLLREIRAKRIERHYEKNGIYRRVEDDLLELDWKGAIVKPMDIDWPLGIGEFFTTYRKNIFLVTGTPDAGKTAFFYDFIKRNQAKHKINLYKSEEMEADIKNRLSKHEDMKIEDWDFKVYSHDHNFAHVIDPDAVSVIDYIDLNNEMFKIGLYIREIYNKIKEGKGICLIGLQKKFNQDMGYGLEFGMKIPRLYLSIEAGTAKILKCKDRRHDDDNATGKILKYKLVGGWKFMPQTGWYRPEDEKLASDAWGKR